MGSSSDLSKATKLATYVVYSCGMGETLAAFGNENKEFTPAVIFDNNSKTVNIEAKELLAKAEELAERTLEKQKSLLIRVADYLSDNRSLNKAKTREFIEKYAIDFNMGQIVENAENLFYRKHLKELAKNI